MNNYEVRVSTTTVDYYRIEAKDAEHAKQQVNVGIASGIMGNIELNDSHKREHQTDYAVQLSPEGEPILWTDQN